MGADFKVAVFNSSASEVEFEIANCQCVYMPENRKIKIAGQSWGVFDELEISENVFTGCFFGKSKFTITAFLGGRRIGATTYRAYNTEKYRFFVKWTLADGMESMAVLGKEIFNSDRRLVFERLESYGDLFFNGRGIYVSDKLRGKVGCCSIGVNSGDGVGDMNPTALVNSNNQLSTNIDDAKFANIVSRWVGTGVEAAGLYSFIKGRPSSAEASSAFKTTLSAAKDMLTAYYSLYRSIILDSDEISVHVYSFREVPTFHVVFSESTKHAEDIMAGNFYMPSPPMRNDNFYDNIMCLKVPLEEIKAAI